MKICPACKQAYSDETLNFCLSDGAVLVQSSANQSTGSLSDAATIAIPIPPNTAGRPHPETIASWQQPTSHPAVVYPKKKSNPWMWIAGILFSLILIGGIAFFGLIALAVIYGDDQNSNQSNKSTTSDTPSINNASTFKKDDLSTWRTEENTFGKTIYDDDEFVMNSKAADYFYVLVSPDRTFLTSNVTTKVTLRNITGKATRLGYGLVVHSDPAEALKKDYAFLIDTVKKSYRIVTHTDKKETDVVAWTSFPAIRGGTETNEIKVKDESGKLTLFINGQLATTVKESADYKEGVAGLYASDAIPIAFSNLELSK